MSAAPRGVILYGPPASGKDTITQALHEIDARYELFPRLKVGPGRTAGYQVTSREHLTELRQAGRLIWETSRYGATYDIDRYHLLHRLDHQIPVLHLGQREAIPAVLAVTPGACWVVVELWVARDVAERRLIERGSIDIGDRLTAWDESPRLQRPDLYIDTGEVSAMQAAERIISWPSNSGTTHRTHAQ